MRLQLARPLVVFDLEATGTDTLNDRIVEIGCVRIAPDGTRDRREWRVNPGIPIPPEATAVHGIHDADVAECPKFADLAAELLEYFAGCDLSGFNVIKYDVPLLREEFRRAELAFPDPGTVVIDSFQLFMRLDPRTLTAATKRYAGRELVDAHSATADAEAAADVLIGQLDEHADLPGDPLELAAWATQAPPDAVDLEGKILWKGGKVVLGFSKFRGRPLADLVEQEPEFLRWMLRKNFHESTKLVVSEALEGRYPEPPAASSASSA